MIVRILGEGQFDVPDGDLDRLNRLDDELSSAVDSGDDAAFSATLGRLLDAVRAHASPHAIDSLDPSDLVLPAADASLDEVRALLGDEGLIPG
jgi:hypothetical protein